jgi:hypothetical protein
VALAKSSASHLPATAFWYIRRVWLPEDAVVSEIPFLMLQNMQLPDNSLTALFC